MSWDNLIGIVAVVIGTILGYLASYFNNRQQRKWQLDSEYRSWKRTEIEKNMALMFDFIQRYITLAHVYVEFTNSPRDPTLKNVFKHTKDNAIEQLRNEKPFPVGLKVGSTKLILDELDKVTDCIVEIAINGNKSKNESMETQLEKMRQIEMSLYAERGNMIEATFK
jgi:hypothetical protein